MTDAELLDLLDVASADPNPAHDIERHATLTRDDAYRLQLARKRRQAERGDPHVSVNGEPRASATAWGCLGDPRPSRGLAGPGARACRCDAEHPSYVVLPVIAP